MGYLGTKAVFGAYQAVIANMPPHDTYIETHLGSGTIMLRKPPSARSIGIEIDPETFAQFGHIPDVETHNANCLDFLRTFDFCSAGRTLIYADPPYVLATRNQRAMHRYRFDYTDADHQTLIAVLRELPASVMLSGYPSDLYTKLLPPSQWRLLTYQVKTRGGPRTEGLWMNYPAGSHHWADYAGRDFIDRQRIKRKALRWREKYAALPAGERLAILAAMLEHEGEAGAEPASALVDG